MNDLQKNLKLGIVGGGQLAKMMLQVAQRLGLYAGILDPSRDCPAASVAHKYTEASFSDGKAILEFANDFDFVTYDLEHVDVSQLLNEGSKVKEKFFPRPETLSLIQDKLVQKQFYLSHDLPTAKLLQVKDIQYPCIWKARKGGYDGYGVAQLKSKEDFLNLKDKVPYLLEEKINIQKELSVVVARGKDGQMVYYPVVEILVDQEKNILDRSCSPAQINDEIASQAIALALKVVEKLEGVGLFAIELLLDENDQIFINEIAPRPHNSGHHTIEGFNVSQFELHLRAVCGVPLIQPVANKAYCGALNLLADPSYKGEVEIMGFSQAMSMQNVFLHIYGKRQAKPGRKMGHVTVLADSYEELMQRIDQLKQVINVRGKEKI
ncbi:MAG TPA: 5-(carboxyamino)imidazole ribonucleotide synthase [Oligoflexia bacterium]|nr:5-(carboxyamino)imidazole ribonucleotide synthase [Oligoflexia bacterium]HMR24553.1 5-(carboxyamino)imidazole ribonucleotide synthase [Oligoflexia bacterium]